FGDDVEAVEPGGAFLREARDFGDLNQFQNAQIAGLAEPVRVEGEFTARDRRRRQESAQSGDFGAAAEPGRDAGRNAADPDQPLNNAPLDSFFLLLGRSAIDERSARGKVVRQEVRFPGRRFWFDAGGLALFDAFLQTRADFEFPPALRLTGGSLAAAVVAAVVNATSVTAVKAALAASVAAATIVKVAFAARVITARVVAAGGAQCQGILFAAKAAIESLALGGIATTAISSIAAPITASRELEIEISGAHVAAD